MVRERGKRHGMPALEGVVRESVLLSRACCSARSIVAYCGVWGVLSGVGTDRNRVGTRAAPQVEVGFYLLRSCPLLPPPFRLDYPISSVAHVGKCASGNGGVFVGCSLAGRLAAPRECASDLVPVMELTTSEHTTRFEHQASSIAPLSSPIRPSYKQKQAQERRTQQSRLQRHRLEAESVPLALPSYTILPRTATFGFDLSCLVWVDGEGYK